MTVKELIEKLSNADAFNKEVCVWCDGIVHDIDSVDTSLVSRIDLNICSIGDYE